MGSALVPMMGRRGRRSVIAAAAGGEGRRMMAMV
jgi:hypothetical protein